MKDTKRTFPYFKFYNRKGMQTYLENMAEKGWLLTQATEFGWHFRRIEPTKLHFSVVYFPKESMFTPGVSENLTRFHEFCAHTGWKLASANAQVQFFYNEAENPVPIETDAVLEVENIHKAVKKRFLPGYFLELFFVIFNLIVLTTQCKSNPVAFLSYQGNLLLYLCWIIVGILSLTEIIGYFSWYKKARKTAKESNSFTEPNGHPEHMLFIIPTLIFGFMSYIGDHVGQGLGLFAALAVLASMLVLGFVSIFLFLRTIRLMQAKKMPACFTCIISILAVVLVCLLFIPFLGNVIGLFTDSASRRAKENAVAYEYEGRTYYAYQDELPLTVSDLMETEYTGYSRRRSFTESFLLSSLECRESPRWDALSEPDLEYRVVGVKIPFLYDFCLDAMLKDFAYDYGISEEPDWAKSLITEAAPWGAEKAYRLILGGELQNRYLLCYENAIVEIDFDWVVTEEQMRKVALQLR